MSFIGGALVIMTSDCDKELKTQMLIHIIINQVADFLSSYLKIRTCLITVEKMKLSP